jgi:tRNA(Ile)-lysidine synthase
MNDIIKFLRKTAKEFGMFSFNDNESRKVLVGFSGGPDSLALLHILLSLKDEYSISVEAAHVNHMLRGDDSDRDENFCRDFCKKHSIILHTTRINVGELAEKQSIGIEEAARNARYGFFEKLMLENDISRLAVAHNANDNAETILFNLARGTGLRGISGIPKIRDFGGGKLIRPLISVSKREILEFLKAEKLEIVTDATNDCTDYTRKYIRHEIIPKFNDIYSDFPKAVKSFSDAAYSAEEFIESEAEKLFNKDGSMPARSVLQTLHPALLAAVINKAYNNAKVILNINGNFTLERVHINALAEQIKGNNKKAEISLPALQAVIDGESLSFKLQKPRIRR